MIGTLDSQVIEKFKEFQEETRKYLNLNIENVQFDNISLANNDYFKFIKGKNKYIQAYITKHPGKYPILGSSLKNKCIANYIQPIDMGDVINEPCVSFNKDNAKGSIPFYREYPFLMDRHHIAILCSDDISPQYLYYSLIIYFEKSQFGWGENVATAEEVSKHFVPVPNDLNEKYKSIDIQKAIAEFLEYSFDNIEIIKNNIDKKYEIVTRIKKSLIPSTFQKTAIKNTFKKYAKENEINFEIIDINFIDDNTFGSIFEFNGGSSRYTMPYYTNSNNKGDYPLLTGSTNIVEFIKPISQNDITNAPGISYNKDNDKGSVAFFHEQPFIVGGHHYSLKLKNEFLETIDLKYSYYLLSEHFSKNIYYQSKEPRANSGVIKDVKFLVPESLDTLSSIDIQRILANFIEYMDNKINEKYFKKYNKFYEVIKLLRETYLKRTFNKIMWS